MSNQITMVRRLAMSLIRKLYHKPFLILLASFGLQLACFWPGFLMPDSAAQYQMALAGVYSDHHPAIMSFLWRYMAMIYPGPGPMFLLQMAMLYGGLYMILKAAESFMDFKRFPWVPLAVACLPFYPQVLLYAIQIQKDNFFAFGFLFVCGALSLLTLRGQPLKGGPFFLLLIVTLYSTAVKYQAQFCAPVLCLWMGFLLARNKPLWIRLGSAAGTACLLYGALFWVNDALVPHHRQSHSWQYVKFFDLAAIAIKTQTDPIPPANKTASYTFEKMQDRFQENAVDPYIYSDDNIFQKTPGDKDSNALLAAWRKAVMDYPFIYLQHRFTNFAYCLMGRVGFSWYDHVASQVIDPHTRIYHMAKNVAGFLGYIFLSQWLVMLLGFIYFIVSIRYVNRSPFAPIVLGFTSISMIMMGILFFMSMAGTPRYTYVSLMMIHGCHVFFYGLYRDIRRQRHLGR